MVSSCLGYWGEKVAFDFFGIKKFVGINGMGTYAWVRLTVIRLILMLLQGIFFQPILHRSPGLFFVV